MFANKAALSSKASTFVDWRKLGPSENEIMLSKINEGWTGRNGGLFDLSQEEINLIKEFRLKKKDLEANKRKAMLI